VNKRYDFDALAKDLARGLSRREALRRVGEGLFGALLASLGLGRAVAQGNSDCAHFCTSIFPPGRQRGDCISAAAHGTGLCYGCGPAAPASHADVCGNFGGPRFCCSADTPNCCNGTCVNTQTDVNNCGVCGKTCASDETCCSGTCANLMTDPQHCTACNQHCPSDSLCCGNGTCCPAQVLNEIGQMVTAACCADGCCPWINGAPPQCCVGNPNLCCPAGSNCCPGDLCCPGYAPMCCVDPTNGSPACCDVTGHVVTGMFAGCPKYRYTFTF
jgi:hypothetical protein